MSITPDAQPGRPFNERAALVELERLQRAIEETRQKRKETGEAFDAWVRSFQKERHDAALAAAAPVVASAPFVPAPAPPAADLPVTPPSAAVAPAIINEVEPDASVEAAPVPAPLAASPVRRRPFPMIPAAAGAVLAVVVAVVLIGRPWGATSKPGSAIRSSSSVASPNADSSQAAGAVGTEPRAATPASRGTDDRGAAAAGSVAAPSSGVTGELTALRRVWVRIISDGNRVERELPAGSVVPLRAKGTLALRIGDAGAVKVVVNNRDQGPLGRDGEVVMRTFTAPTPAR